MQTAGIASSLGGGVEYRKFTITYADIAAAATTKVISLFTLPASGKILGVYAKHSVAFSGGSISSMTVQVGYSGATNAYLGASDIYTTVGDAVVYEAALFKAGKASAVAVEALFTGSHNTNTATAGSVDIYVLFLNVTTP